FCSPLRSVYPVGRRAIRAGIIGRVSNRCSSIKNSIPPARIQVFIRFRLAAKAAGIVRTVIEPVQLVHSVGRLNRGGSPNGSSRNSEGVIVAAAGGILPVKDHLRGILSLVMKQFLITWIEFVDATFYHCLCSIAGECPPLVTQCHSCFQRLRSAVSCPAYIRSAVVDGQCLSCNNAIQLRDYKIDDFLATCSANVIVNSGR